MTKPVKRFSDGPSQVLPAPDRLVGRVVDWHDGGAIHGFGVLDDLAVHYAPHEVLLLGLTGSPPSIEQGRAFGAALTWIVAAHVGTAPTHAAVLGQISGAPITNLMSIIVLAAGREAESTLTDHQRLLDWLDQADPRPRFTAWSQREPGWRQRLFSASGLDLPELDVARDPSSAALIVFHAVGLRDRARLVSAWVWSRMIGGLAESLNEQPLTMRSYPLRVPAFDYVEDP